MIQRVRSVAVAALVAASSFAVAAAQEAPVEPASEPGAVSPGTEYGPRVVTLGSTTESESVTARARRAIEIVEANRARANGVVCRRRPFRGARSPVPESQRYAAEGLANPNSRASRAYPLDDTHTVVYVICDNDAQGSIGEVQLVEHARPIMFRSARLLVPSSRPRALFERLRDVRHFSYDVDAGRATHVLRAGDEVRTAVFDMVEGRGFVLRQYFAQTCEARVCEEASCDSGAECRDGSPLRYSRPTNR